MDLKKEGMRIAINGIGRIGKSFLPGYLLMQKAAKKIEIAAINVGKGDPGAAALALKLIPSWELFLGVYVQRWYFQVDELTFCYQ